MGTGLRGINGRKKRDNCDSIINRIYLKNSHGVVKFSIGNIVNNIVIIIYGTQWVLGIIENTL